LSGAQLWTSISALSISETLQLYDADIHLKFAGGEHGDTFPFDGEGGVLAHAFYPENRGFAGHVHFDDAENWSNDNRREGYVLPLSVCLSVCQQDNWKSCWRILMKFIGGVRRLTSNIRLDPGSRSWFQSCPWVGLTRGLGWVGLGREWVENLCF